MASNANFQVLIDLTEAVQDLEPEALEELTSQVVEEIRGEWRVEAELVRESEITELGKPGLGGFVGYAPSEQIQTGRAYPSSDLYSLAATAVVLLTGKEPQSLFDDNSLTWNWRRWANVSDEFANVLNRMLAYRPGDRYQSAIDVMKALQSASTGWQK